MSEKDIKLRMALLLIKAMQDKYNNVDPETVEHIKEKFDFNVGRKMK